MIYPMRWKTGARANKKGPLLDPCAMLCGLRPLWGMPMFMLGEKVRSHFRDGCTCMVRAQEPAAGGFGPAVDRLEGLCDEAACMGAGVGVGQTEEDLEDLEDSGFRIHGSRGSG